MSGSPQLPREVSANGAEIWEWGHSLSEWAQRQDNIRRLRAEVAQVDCGGCALWMTRQCPRERNINGRNHGPSMNGSPCVQYAEKPSTAALRATRAAELPQVEVTDADREAAAALNQSVVAAADMRGGRKAILALSCPPANEVEHDIPSDARRDQSDDASRAPLVRALSACENALVEQGVQAAISAGLAVNGKSGVAAARVAARFVLLSLKGSPR